MPSHPLPAGHPLRPVPEPFPAFAGLRLVHAALRRDLARLPDALLGLRPGDEARAEALQRHWDLMTAMVISHHDHQDTFLWPVLRRLAPELRLLLNWLETDHHHLDNTLAQATTVVGIATRDPNAAWSAMYAIEEFAARVDAHIRIEERQLLPRMAAVLPPDSRLGTLPDLLDLIRAIGTPAPSDALVWLLDGLPPHHIDHLLAACDDQTARHWPHWHDTYTRCTTPLWG